MKDNKKIFGQFFTNPVIANFMIDLALTETTRTFLDPAVGEGIFTSLAKRKNPNIRITACEIERSMIKAFKEKNKYEVDLIEADYLDTQFQDKFDCIVCNPPYNKFQEFKNRDDIRAKFKKKYGINIVGYSNVCVYFLIKSMNEMADNGRCCFIIPYEFLNTGYGTVIKQYLLSSKKLKSIYKFSNRIKLFDNSITTSCILLLENSIHDHVELINIDDIKEIGSKSFTSHKTYNYAELDPTEKWRKYFDFIPNNDTYCNLVHVSEFGRVSRGIATGNNSYFALNQSMITKYGLSKEVCLPCVTKSPDVKGLVITEESFNTMKRMDKKVYLFNGSNALSENDYLYIQYGEEIGANKAYLTSHRTPWFLIEEKAAAPILLSVFNRGKMKVIRNEAMVKNLTAFHGFFLKNDDFNFANLMFCYFLTPIAQKLLYWNKREYGDGLDKFEPGDLNQALMLDLRIMRKDDVNRVLDIYSDIKREQKVAHMEALNAIFEKYAIKSL